MPKWKPKHPGKALPPQYAVAKSDGNDAVQAWIDLLPEWQTAQARRVDAVVTHVLPEVHKAVKWHGVWYGMPVKGWILAEASFKAHIKLVFFDGAALTPLPPILLASKPQRAIDLRDGVVLDESQLADWIRQSSLLPGWGKA